MKNVTTQGFKSHKHNELTIIILLVAFGHLKYIENMTDMQREWFAMKNENVDDP